MVNIVLYQPDIPQNLGAIMRLAACFGAALHIVEPCGFPLDDKRIKRAGMDYIDSVTFVRHDSWEDFLTNRGAGDLCLLTTKGATSLYETKFAADDWLVFGRESAGVPDEVAAQADKRIIIPMESGQRSLNIAMSAAIAVSEVRRQLR